LTAEPERTGEAESPADGELDAAKLAVAAELAETAPAEEGAGLTAEESASEHSATEESAAEEAATEEAPEDKQN
jgi:hypothetical protein